MSLNNNKLKLKTNKFYYKMMKVSNKIKYKNE